MQEKPNGQIGSQLPKHAGHELQLIILHPHGGIGGGNLGRGFCKLPVHPLVGIPPIAVIPGGHNQIMVQRPQGGISEPLVKLLIIRLGKTHRVEQNPRLGAERLGGLRGGAGPTNPTTMMLRQHRGQRGNQAAGTGCPHRCAIIVIVQIDGQPVGNHHKVIHLCLLRGLFSSLLCGLRGFLCGFLGGGFLRCLLSSLFRGFLAALRGLLRRYSIRILRINLLIRQACGLDTQHAHQCHTVEKVFRIRRDNLAGSGSGFLLNGVQGLRWAAGISDLWWQGAASFIIKNSKLCKTNILRYFGPECEPNCGRRNAR